jgi:putative membrane protein
MSQEASKPVDPREGLAHHRTSLATFRTQLALDRTTLAWVRTALTMASFGFGMVAFFRSLREAAPGRRASGCTRGPSALASG